MKQKGVSVIVPAYNAENTIRKCLMSAAEDGACTEVIVINDGSTDRTEKIVRQLSEQEKKIRLFTVENGGVSKARNIGLRESSQDYVMFLDADDRLGKNSISYAFQLAEMYQLDLCFFDAVEEDSGKGQRNVGHRQDYVVERSDIGKYIMESRPKNSWAKLLRWSVIEENDLTFDETISYAEDYIFMLQFYLHVHRLGYCSTALYRIGNVNPRSLSKRYHNNMKQIIEKSDTAQMALFRKYRDYEREYFKRNIGLQLYYFIVYADNLFKSGSPFGFWQKYEKIKEQLSQFEKTEELKKIRKCDLPKRKMDKFYYLIIKMRSPFLISIVFEMKNKWKRAYINQKS